MMGSIGWYDETTVLVTAFSTSGFKASAEKLLWHHTTSHYSIFTIALHYPISTLERNYTVKRPFYSQASIKQAFSLAIAS